MDQALEKIREVISESSNVVLISGSEVMRETGLNGVRAEHMAYEIEDKYGYSSDEIVSSMFLGRQVETFYDFYRNVILNKPDAEPTGVYKAAARMEKQGRLTAVVTRMIYGLYQKAGCENVIEVYGSAEQNRCPVCGRVYGSQYIREADSAPHCAECGVILRPGFTLFGEMIDNGRLTKACDVIENADVLIVAGMALRSATWAGMLRYYEGNKLILISTHEHDGDDKADYRVYGNISDIFEAITPDA